MSARPMHDAAPRTIEDIERRAAQIEQAERDAFATLAAVLRELAVTLPEGSTTIYDFAKLANNVDVLNTGTTTLRNSTVHLAVANLVHDYAERRREDDES